MNLRRDREHSFPPSIHNCRISSHNQSSMTLIPPRLPTSCIFGKVARNFILEELAVHHWGVRARVHFPSISTLVVIRSRLSLDTQRRGEWGDVCCEVWFEEEWDATRQSSGISDYLVDDDDEFFPCERGAVRKGLPGSCRLEERLTYETR